jgi:acetolactate synthase-1/2/3 large subunit
MLREFMKWDYELRHAEQVETVIDRALAIARASRRVRLRALPREILAPFPRGLLGSREDNRAHREAIPGTRRP